MLRFALFSLAITLFTLEKGDAYPLDFSNALTSNGKQYVMMESHGPLATLHGNYTFRLRRFHSIQDLSSSAGKPFSVDVHLPDIKQVTPIHMSMSPSGALAVWFGMKDHNDPLREAAGPVDSFGLMLLNSAGELDLAFNESGLLFFRHSMIIEHLMFIDDRNFVLFATDPNPNENRLTIFWYKKENTLVGRRNAFTVKKTLRFSFKDFIKSDKHDSANKDPLLMSRLSHAVMNTDGSLLLAGTITIVDPLASAALPSPTPPPLANRWFFVARLDKEGDAELRAFRRIPRAFSDADVAVIVTPDFKRLTLVSANQMMDMLPTGDSMDFAEFFVDIDLDLKGLMLRSLPYVFNYDWLGFLASDRNGNLFSMQSGTDRLRSDIGRPLAKIPLSQKSLNPCAPQFNQVSENITTIVGG